MTESAMEKERDDDEEDELIIDHDVKEQANVKGVRLSAEDLL